MIEQKIKKNNLAIAFNTFHAKNEEIHPVCCSEHNSNREKQTFF